MRHPHAAGAATASMTAAAAADAADRQLNATPYECFRRAVVRRQVGDWATTLPTCTVLDLSGAGPDIAELLIAGSRVLCQLRDPARRHGAHTSPPPTSPAGRAHPVVASQACLGWVRPTSVGAVLVRASGSHWAADTPAALAALQRLLKPGGSLLLEVDSLVLGLSRLAGQGDWQTLADVPRAGTLILPSADGTSTRFFRTAELGDVLGRAGFEVDWIRPRTVLTPDTVARMLAQQVSADTILDTELALADRADPDTTGLQLVVCAHRPG